MEQFTVNISMDNENTMIFNCMDETHKLYFSHKNLLEPWFQHVCSKENTKFDNEDSQFVCDGEFNKWIEEVTDVQIYEDTCSFKLTNDKMCLHFYFRNEIEANDYMNTHMQFYKETEVC